MPCIQIACPSLPDVHNGNAHTAARWAAILADMAVVQILPPAAHADLRADLLIALHARRSAAAIAHWHQSARGRPVALVLTGTDLYRDIRTDADAQRSLELANVLVVLQEQGLAELPPRHRHKARVIYQSAPRLPTLDKPRRPFKVAMVGHLRDEKDPLTFLMAAERLASHDWVELHHLGKVLEPQFVNPLAATGWRNEHYHWHGGVSAQAARVALQQAHLSVLTSRMEGGAHAILESVMAGTPVIASRVGGNVGMLGSDYGGFFEPGKADELAAQIDRAEQDRNWLGHLQSQCEARAHLFEPERERQAVLHLAESLLN